MKISQKDAQKMQKQLAGVSGRMKKLKAKAGEAVEVLVQSVEIGTASLGMGLVNGYFVDDEGNRGIQLFGVPLDLGGAILLHGLGFVGGKYAEHAHNFGDGLLAAFLTTLGMGVGDKMRTERLAREGQGAPAAALPAAAAGLPPAIPGGRASGMSAAELQQLAMM
jgi:hypothetical protein